MSAHVYLGLGSNLPGNYDSPLAVVQHAIATIAALPMTQLISHSPLIATPAIGPVQPDYINCVVAISTTLSPLTLLFKTQQIEQAFGRSKTIRWGARILDIDLLTYDDVQLRYESLTLPHPQIDNRPFVKEALAQLAKGVR